jgi:hypothetical protein
LWGEWLKTSSTNDPSKEAFMKILFIAPTAATLAVLLFQSPAFSAPLSAGEFQGPGLWKSATGATPDHGSYTETTKVTENSVFTTYTLASGVQKNWDFQMLPAAPAASGFFQVQSHNKVIGSGYCLEQAQVCHYAIEAKVGKGHISLEETIAQVNGRMFRYGSKDEGKGSVMWQEALDKK